MGPVVLGGLNALILLTAWLFRQTVVPGWKKGPLIDPASPYSPENAAWLFACGACLFLNLYMVGVWGWRRLGVRGVAAVLGPVAVLAGAAGLTEAGLQAWLQYDMVTYFRPHPTLQWEVRPGLVNFDNLKGGGTLNTNEDGMREVRVPRPKPAGTTRVLVLGDSSNFGHGVEGFEMWSTVLQQELEGKTGGRVEVLNGACPGWSTVSALVFMQERGLSWQPDIVIAGFNNDPGPEYLEDKARIPPPILAGINGLLFRSESYLLGREVLLSLVRRANAGNASFHYTERRAGEEPKYGKLSGEEQEGLVPRVSLADFRANLHRLNALGKEHNYRFAWLNMPINRWEPEFVSRYVNPDYRRSAEQQAQEEGWLMIDVDARWRRTREQDVHAFAHVFHPNAKGHRRMAEQIARELMGAGYLSGDPAQIRIGGPQPVAAEPVLRLGFSSKTPVHAHLGAAMADHPEILQKYNLEIAATPYASGKDQGDAIASGDLDAFFTCEVPAIQMLQDRPDLRLVASPGSLGRIAVVSRLGSLQELRGRKVGIAKGSTPAMDWETWGGGIGAQVVELKTDAMQAALRDGSVDAVAGWDPWIEQWLQEDPSLRVLAEREFRSALALSVPWAAAEPGRGARLIQALTDLGRIVAADRARYDAAAAQMGGWPLAVVRAVADRNGLLTGRGDLTWQDVDTRIIDRAGAFAAQMRAVPGLPSGLSARDLVFPGLLTGVFPGYRADVLAVQAKGGGKGPPGPPGGKERR